MPANSRHPLRNPRPWTPERQPSTERLPPASRPASPQGRGQVVAPSASSGVTGWKQGALLIVLAGVTLSMLMSLAFLWAGFPLRPLPVAWPFAWSWSAFGLMSLGAGLGALGCITCSWFLNRHAGALVAQRGGPLPTTQRGPAHTRRSSPLDATSRSTDELVAPDAQHFLNGWCSSLWDEERYQQMSQRETGHLRQRLRTLHFSSTADTREAAEEML